ncbi:hypothetical protein BDZ91DRAFT_648680, partial [Kalaharituber pfeilii]
KPAYTTTFNSCQGLSLNRAVIYLRRPVFSHRQFYTSVSRVHSRNHIRTLIPTTHTHNVQHYTTNISGFQIRLSPCKMESGGQTSFIRSVV